MSLCFHTTCLYTISSSKLHSRSNKQNKNHNRTYQKPKPSFPKSPPKQKPKLKPHQKPNPKPTSPKSSPKSNPKPKPRFPKSSPTQLLTSHKLQSSTKLEALETVINQIEASVKNGVEINDPGVFASLLETCFNSNAIDLCNRIHKLIPKTLLRRNAGISSKLLRLYSCNGDLDEAHKVFDQMPSRNSSSFPWNSLISGYANAGSYEDALALYFQMVEEGVEPDEYTFPRALKACGGVGMIQAGEEIHRHVIRYGRTNNPFVQNGLLDMYSKCGDIIKARKVFDTIVNKDLVSWNSMIIGYIRHDLIVEALDLLRLMFLEKCEPDSITLSSLLTSIPPYKTGRETHGLAFRLGLDMHISVSNSLLVFYSKHNKLELVRRSFNSMRKRDSVSWNSIISAHSKDSMALEYFKQMLSSNALPDSITFVSLLSACAHLGMVDDGERLFSMMKETYGIRPIMEHYACMVNLYGRVGLVEKGYDVIVNAMEFEAGPTVWGALLYGCSLHNNVKIGEIAARSLFELEPDNEHNFELLMRIYGNVGRPEDVERVRLLMLDRGLGL